MNINEKKVNPWAVCHASTGPEKSNKFERCVKKVKKNQGVKEMNTLNLMSEKIVERFQQKIEESILLENFVIFCEQENIDVDSLTEEQINEIFGALQRMGGAAKRGFSGAKKIISQGISNTANAMSKGAEQGWNKNVQAGHTGLKGLYRKTGGALKGMAKEAGKGALSGAKKLAAGTFKTGLSMAKAGLAKPSGGRGDPMAKVRQQRADRARFAAAIDKHSMEGGKGDIPKAPDSIASQVAMRARRGLSKYGDSTELFGNKIVEGFSLLLNELSIKTLKSYRDKASAQDPTTTPMKREKGISKASEKIARNASGKNTRRSVTGSKASGSEAYKAQGKKGPSKPPMSKQEIDKAKGTGREGGTADAHQAAFDKLVIGLSKGKGKKKK